MHHAQAAGAAQQPRYTRDMTALIKASYFAGNVAALAALGPDVSAEARRRLPTTIAALESASRADWLSVEHDIALSRVVAELAGVEGVHVVNRHSFTQALHAPVLRPLFASAVSLFGLTPRAILRVMPSGWGAGMKDAGTVHVTFDDDGHGAQVEHRDFIVDAIWHEGLVGVLLGACDVTEHTGTATMSMTPAGARYRLRWQSRR